MSDLPTDLVVGTMCHCQEQDEDADTTDCYGHWEFYYDATIADEELGIVARGRQLNKKQMDAIAALVNADAEVGKP